MRRAAIVAVAGWLGLAVTAGAQPPRLSAVDVHIEDIAAVPAHLLERARVECGYIFARAGVVVRWTVRARTITPSAGTLTLIIVDAAPQLPPSGVDPLGMAPAGDARHRGRIAYVFYDRVEAYARPRADERARFFDTGQILGAVFAHELGHLLLPLNARHADAGIMRGIWNAHQFQLAAFGRLDFTADEAASIRDSLRGRTGSSLAGGSP